MRNFDNEIQLDLVSNDSFIYSKDQKSVFTEFPIKLNKFVFKVPSIEASLRPISKSTSIGSQSLLATSFLISSS